MAESNILKHVLVPEHTVLSKDEKQKLLDDLKISESQLPSISIKDPVVMLLKTIAGDVIKIIRKSGNNTHTSYRRVV
jgi:DNA-directed RNA polymerase subunit H|tara:strand:+ start:369 stop:599 length:231 start_codon:yes stop_codon:yes gene_type:complete